MFIQVQHFLMRHLGFLAMAGTLLHKQQRTSRVRLDLYIVRIQTVLITLDETTT